MTLLFIRSLFVIMSGVIGYYIGILVQHPLLGAELGCLERSGHYFYRTPAAARFGERFIEHGFRPAFRYLHGQIAL